MGWLAKLRAKRDKTEAEKAAQRAGGRWENEGGALAPAEEAEIENEVDPPRAN